MTANQIHARIVKKNNVSMKTVRNRLGELQQNEDISSQATNRKGTNALGYIIQKQAYIMSQWTFAQNNKKGTTFTGTCKKCGKEVKSNIVGKINGPTRYVSCPECGKIVSVEKNPK